MKQHPQFVFQRHFAHNGHQQRVVVDRDVGLFEHRSTFELVGCYFVVAGFNRNAEPVSLFFELLHIFQYAARDRSEIVVVELLVFCRDVPHQRPSGLHQVGTCEEERFVYQEVLLLPAQRDVHLFDIFVEILADILCGFANHLQRFEQRGLEVERFARISDKNAWDAEGFVDDKGRRRRIPG